MLTNDVITILRYDEETDVYKPVISCAAWVFRKSANSGTVKGDESADVIHIRIAKECAEHVEKGDLVHFGGKVDVGNIILADCREITRVTKNHFGSAPHWHLEIGV